MPISQFGGNATQSNPYAALTASQGNPNTMMPGLNLPTGFQMPNLNPNTMTTGLQGIKDLLTTQPQSLTNLMAPLYQQLLSTQGGALSSAYNLQGQQGAAQAVSDAAARGITGSSIEEGGIQSALAGAGQGYQQALASLLGTITGQYGQTAQFDIGQVSSYYQNLAQALGQEYSSTIQQQQFEEALQAGQAEGSAANKAGLWSAGIGALGGLGGAGIKAFSDLRLKTGERRIGTWHGLPLWRFRYTAQAQRQHGAPGGEHVGLMAHEVPAAYTGAVDVKDGLLRIDYRRLLTCLAVDLSLRSYLGARAHA